MKEQINAFIKDILNSKEVSIDMDKISGIYCILNTVNNKRYIGKSNNIYKRWTGERSDLRRNVFHNTHFQRAWNKYGEQAFQWLIIDICPEEDLMNKEIEWIAYYNAYFDGYNQTFGGEGSLGAVCSDEKRRKLIESHSGDKPYRKHVYCIELDQEFWCAKEAARVLNQCGYRVSGQQISRCCRGVAVYSGKLPNGNRLHWCYASNKDTFKVPVTTNDVPVYCIELNEFFDNCVTAQNDSRIYKAHSDNIILCCNGSQSHTVCGQLEDGTKLTWRFLTDEEFDKLFVIIHNK